MQVSKWGNSLAVRLPTAVVKALRLREGDEIEIHVLGEQSIDIGRKPGAQELLRACASIVADSRRASGSIGSKRMNGPEAFYDTNVSCICFHPIPLRRIGPRPSWPVEVVSRFKC